MIGRTELDVVGNRASFYSDMALGHLKNNNQWELIATSKAMAKEEKKNF